MAVWSSILARLYSMLLKTIKSCSSSSFIFFNDDIIQGLKQDISLGMKLNRNVSLDILIYADDAVLIQQCEIELQYS